MNLADVMDQVAAQLDTIPGLRVYAWPVVAVAPPTAIVVYPLNYDYDLTYGRGSDTMTLPVAIMVGKATERTSRDDLAKYMDGSGAYSVKTVLERGVHTGAYHAFDTLRVTKVETDVKTMSNVDYLVAAFQLDIAGSGS